MRRQVVVPDRKTAAIAYKPHLGRDFRMDYLIVQLLPYLMLIFFIGIIVGWSSAGK